MEDNMNDNSDSSTPKKRSWLIPIVTTFIGVLASLLVAWYQINLNEEQALEAVKERAKSVQNELVQIVEEHVINQKSLDVNRLARLADFRAKQENLEIAPRVSAIIENAEFNIIKSQYLEFEKKQQFKEIFNGIYSELAIPDNIKYSGLFENTVNDIYASLQNGNKKDVPVKINKLVTDFNIKIDELEAKIETRERTSVTDIVRIIFDEPKFLIITISIYGILLYLVIYSKRRKRLRKKYEEKINHEIWEEYMRERNQAAHKSHKSHNADNEE